MKRTNLLLAACGALGLGLVAVTAPASAQDMAMHPMMHHHYHHMMHHDRMMMHHDRMMMRHDRHMMRHHHRMMRHYRMHHDTM